MRWKVLLWLGIAACISPAADSAATFDASLSLAAREAAGVSASAKPLVVTIAARGTGGGLAVFAPYIDMGLAASGNLLTIQRDCRFSVDSPRHGAECIAPMNCVAIVPLD
jgi:hypothetical protein